MCIEKVPPHHMETSQDQVHSKEKVRTFTTYPSTNLPQRAYTRVSETFLFTDSFWLRKISMDRPIISDVNSVSE